MTCPSRQVLAAALALLAACERDDAAPTAAPAPAPTCPGDSAAFVQRALPVLQGRRPYGVREVRLLAALVDQLDAAGADGRRLVAAGLARGPLYERRWAHFLADHLGAIRSGDRHNPACWAPRTAAADGPGLAAHVRDHDPGDMSARTGWSMTDLLASAIALDDVRPALRGQLLARMTLPLYGANVGPAELEQIRRNELAIGFEVRWLGRRRECLACHADDASVTDAADAADDRFWPLVPGLDAAVFGALPPADAALDAAFRVDGVLGGPLAPWGIDDACVRLDPGRGGDLLDEPGHLAGPLPAHAHVLDLDARLRAGMDDLGDLGDLGMDDRAAAVAEPPTALAAMVASHLADAAWTEVVGAPLTLAHGHPRNAAARDVLVDLTTALVDERWSLRALVVAAVVHRAADLAAPSTCAVDLAPIVDPWRPVNDAADLVHRPGPWLLLDSAHTALGWPLAHAFPEAVDYPDAALLARLGVALEVLDDGLPSTDFVGQLAWETRYAAGEDPRLGAPATGPDWVARLLAVAPADATVADLAIAVADRLLAEPDLSRGTSDALAELLATPLATPLADIEPAAREALARRLVGACLMTPQFLLHGRPPPRQQGAPRWVTPEATTRALCEAHADLLAPAWTIACDDAGPRVARGR